MSITAVAEAYRSTPWTHPLDVWHAHGAPGGPGCTALHQPPGTTQVVPGCANADGTTEITKSSVSANWRLKRIMAPPLSWIAVATSSGTSRLHANPSACRAKSVRTILLIIRTILRTPGVYPDSSRSRSNVQKHQSWLEIRRSGPFLARTSLARRGTAASGRASQQRKQTDPDTASAIASRAADSGSPIYLNITPASIAKTQRRFWSKEDDQRTN